MIRMQAGQRLLDIGQGSVSALVEVAPAVRGKRLTVVCIEQGRTFLQRDANMLVRAGLQNNVILHCKSLYDSTFQHLFRGESRFNAVCFSSPLMDFSDPPAALRVAAALLKEGGSIYIPQVRDETSSALLKFLSLLIKGLHLTKSSEIKKVADEADMEVLDEVDAVGVDGKTPRAARVLVLRPIVRSGVDTDGKATKVRSRKAVEATL